MEAPILVAQRYKTGTEHKSSRGRGLLHQTIPQVQAVHGGLRDSAALAEYGIHETPQPSDWISIQEHLHQVWVGSPKVKVGNTKKGGGEQ